LNFSSSWRRGIVRTLVSVGRLSLFSAKLVVWLLCG